MSLFNDKKIFSLSHEAGWRLNNDFVSTFKGFQPGRDVSKFDEYLLLHRKQADHMVVVCLLLVSLNVFQLMRNCRVTSFISLPSRTTKSREHQFDQLLAS